MSEDKAYGRRGGRTSAERELARASEEYGKTQEGQNFAALMARLLLAERETAQLRAKVEELENFNRGLRGERGIEVKGSIISLRKRADALGSVAFEGLEIEFCELDEGTGLPTGDTLTRVVLALPDGTAAGETYTLAKPS